MKDFYFSDKRYTPIIELYLLLLFGDQQRTRLVPDWFVDEENLFASGVIRIEKVTSGLPAAIEPPAGFLDIHPYMDHERTEVLRGIRRAIDKLNPVILSTLEAVYTLGKCLTDPDNHIKTRTGQQLLTERPSRTIIDMTNEMQGELIKLPKFTAYAKVIQGHSIWRGKIKTHPLPDVVYVDPRDKSYSEGENWRESVRNWTGSRFAKTRKEIAEEMRLRQEGWRAKIKKAVDIKLQPSKPGRKPLTDEPPPIRY